MEKKKNEEKVDKTVEVTNVTPTPIEVSTPVVTPIEKPVKEPTELDKINGIFTVKNIRKTWLTSMPGNKDGRSLHSGIKVRIVPERHWQTGLTITGLTKAQQEEFEQAMNKKPGDLSPYSDFWNDYHIDMSDAGLIIDANSSVKAKLDLCILKANSKVANSQSDVVFTPSAEWVISSIAREKETESKALDLKTRAYARLSTMSIEERYNFLKVYEEGKYKVSKGAKPDFINAQLGQIVDKSPDKFIETFNNPYYDAAILLQSALDIRAITKQGQKYYITGGEKIGDSYINTLMNLTSPDWDEAKISLLGKLDNYNK